MTALPTTIIEREARDARRHPRLSRPEDQPRLTAEEAAASGQYITADDFEQLQHREGWELLDGRLVERTMSLDAASVGGDTFGLIWTHVRQNGLGLVLPQDTAFRCFGPKLDRVRKPDVAFIRKDRLPPRPWRKDAVTVPDLTVEVVSTNDEIEPNVTKALQLLDAGVRQTWFVMPISRAGLVVNRDGTARLLREGDAFDGGGLLPGFSLPLGDVLPPPEAADPQAAGDDS